MYVFHEHKYIIAGFLGETCYGRRRDRGGKKGCLVFDVF
jgi:hypothetical protein